MENNLKNQKRYNTLDGFFKEKFGCKIAKISLNAGFTCPNRDGTKASGGCVFCSDLRSGEFAGNALDNVETQFDSIKKIMSKKWKNTKYIPYFQAGTNTYAPTEKLKQLYEAVLVKKDVVGLAIATRPDCISDITLEYLNELNRRTFLTVELGLQTIFDKTGEKINRQTDFAEFLECFNKLKLKNIPVCVHLINGLPGENREMMMQSVKTVSELKPWAIKLHLLHVISGTVCEKMYEQKQLEVMDFKAYVNLICDQLEIIDKSIIIQRLTGDGARNTLTAPLWSLKKFEVLNAIDREMENRDSFQGCRNNT